VGALFQADFGPDVGEDPVAAHATIAGGSQEAKHRKRFPLACSSAEGTVLPFDDRGA
jgi:hypothetical protein